jgi:hypothetical protein
MRIPLCCSKAKDGKIKLSLLYVIEKEVKVKLSRYRPWTGPWGSMSLRLLEFVNNRHRKMVR